MVFDSAMRCISEAIERMVYHRASIEGMCCEAHHGRITMEKFEVYVKGSSIHMLSQYGGPMFKKVCHIHVDSTTNVDP